MSGFPSPLRVPRQLLFKLFFVTVLVAAFAIAASPRVEAPDAPDDGVSGPAGQTVPVSQKVQTSL
jgi:hypothetical protein